MKILALSENLGYDTKGVWGNPSPADPITQGLLTMKLAIRIFALLVVVAGGAAAALTPKTAPILPSHQSATAGFPIATCGPGIPTCPQTPPPGIR
jgi:hypothetical protein